MRTVWFPGWKPNSSRQPPHPRPSRTYRDRDRDRQIKLITNKLLCNIARIFQHSHLFRHLSRTHSPSCYSATKQPRAPASQNQRPTYTQYPRITSLWYTMREWRLWFKRFSLLILLRPTTADECLGPQDQNGVFPYNQFVIAKDHDRLWSRIFRPQLH